MREIKFRAWSTISERIIPHELQTVGLKNVNNKPSHLVFMQYTGLKDRTGKEIYEGDIVELWFDGEVKFKSVVYFKDASFCVDRGGVNGKTTNLYGWCGSWEVIGNIYENPELLTKEPDAQGSDTTMLNQGTK